MSSIDNKTYSRTAEYRKICKPIVERKRRARMNKSLIELKSIILDVVKKDGCQYSKLEKADILEMTVKHLHQLRRSQQQVAQVGAKTQCPRPEESLDKFRAGFVQCAAEVSRFMCQVDGSHQDSGATRVRLIHHLNSCVGQLEQLSAPANSATSPSYQSVKNTTPSSTHHQHQPLRVYTPPNSPMSLASSSSSASSVYNLSPVMTSTKELSRAEMTSPLALTTQKASPWRPW